MSVEEASTFALNMISDGSTVTMTTGAPRLRDTLRERGLDVVRARHHRAAQGGGGVRCTALTLDNRLPSRAR
ncbi:hypothetical protein [Streptomyces sp. KL116D]|uniref:hypothetical protein n=1 Tax=Streptomyces sp. KL116D TaxID=3045152 RepID=UPI003556ED10